MQRMTGGRFALITTAAVALSSALNFAALFLWVRLLSPQDFGTYALASASALLLNALAFEWLRVTAARTLYDPTHESQIAPAMSDALLAVTGAATILLCLGGAVAIGSNATVGGVAPRLVPVVLLFAISEMSLGMVNVVSRVRMQAWRFFLSMVMRSVVAIVLGIALVREFGMGSDGILIAIVTAQLLTAAALILTDRQWRSLRIGRASRSERQTFRAIWTLGGPLIISTALTYLAGVLDRYLIDAVLGPAAVGYYAAASDLLQKTLGFALLAINITAYPALVRAYEDHGKAAARKLLEDNFVLQAAVGVPAVVAMILLAPGIAGLLLGPNFRDQGEALLPWLAVAALLRLLVTYHLLMVFQLTRRMGLMTVAPVATIAVLLPLGLVLLRELGLVGMAIAALAAYATCYVLCWAIARRLLSFRLLTCDLAKILIASMTMGAALLPFTAVRTTMLTIGAIALGGFVYVTVLLLLRPDRARPAIEWCGARLRRL